MSAESMGPSAPTTPSTLQAYTDELLGLAETAVDHGLAHGEPPPVDIAAWPHALQTEHASFVTWLDAHGGLRGCIGSIEAHRPLVSDVTANAFAAAFEDPRFPPLAPHERSGLRCHLSILTPAEPIAFADEADILRTLRPGIDGVLIESGSRRGTLLPAVWEQLPNPRDFWQTLKAKAGIEAHGLPEDLVVYRYQAEHIG